MHYFWHLETIPLNSKHTEASFCPTRQIYYAYSLLRFLDLQIYVDNNTDNDNDTTDYFTPYACVWGDYTHIQNEGTQALFQIGEGGGGV